MLTLDIAKQPLVIGAQINFVVVGCGGTGGYLIRDLARLVSINNDKYKRHDYMTLIDADDVELKNISRQNFIVKDVGRAKAEVLAERYSAAFGLRIDYINQYLTKQNSKEFLFGIDTTNPRDILNQGGFPKRSSINKYLLTVVLGCVDNNKTRQIISDAVKSHYNSSHTNVVYVDSGNEEIAGQVVTSMQKVFEYDKNTNGSTPSYALRSVSVQNAFDHFNMVANDRHPDELSCADRAMSAPQNIGTNITAGLILFNIANQILTGSSRVIAAYNKALGYTSVNEDETEDEATMFENGRNGEYIRSIINRVPKIPYHIIYFNSVSSSTTVVDYSAEAQSAF